MARVARLFSLFLAFQLMGGHWIALQSVAWTNMTLVFAEEMSLPEAVIKAVSGQAPCKVCQMVREGQRHESEKAAMVFSLKIEAVVVGSVEIAPLWAELPSVPQGATRDRDWSRRLYPPLTPPPNA